MISNPFIKKLIPTIFMSRFAIIICMLIIGNWFVFIPWKIEEIGLLKKNFGYILLLFGIGSIFSMQATNKLLIQKLGPHFLLSFGVIAFSIIIFLWVSTETAFTFALMALPVGLSFGVINPCAIVITVETEQATGQRLLPLHHACFSIGSLFGVLIGGFFASLAFSPLSLFFALMMLGILYGLTCLLFSNTQRQIRPVQKFRFGIPTGDTLFLGPVAAISMGTIGIILDWSALWLTRDIGLALALGGVGIFAFNSSEIVARMFGTSLIARFGERGMGTSAMLLGCVSMAAATYSQSLAAIVFGFAALGFCSANFIPLVMGLAARRNPENASKIVSDVTTVSFTGFLFGPPLVGLVAEYISITACMYMLSVIWGLSALMMRPYFLKRGHIPVLP